MNQCKVTAHWYDTDHTTRCVRPEGHTGLHRDTTRWFDQYGFQHPQHGGWAETHPGELYVSTSLPRKGQCGFMSQHEDVRLLCPLPAVPGDTLGLCLRHRDEHDAERSNPRRFPAAPVVEPPVISSKENAK